VAIDPNNRLNAYAAGEAGVFRSTDGGVTWDQAMSGIPTRRVFVVAVDPGNGMRLLAGTEVGMFTSSNGGSNWSAANDGIAAGEQVLRIFFDPTAATVWAGTNTPNVYRSSTTGGGFFWSSMSGPGTPGLPAPGMNRFTHGLAVDGSGAAYIATFGGGCYRLANSGTMWAALPTPLDTGYFDSLAHNRLNPNIFIGSNAGAAPLYRGTGTTFAAANTGLGLSTITAIGIASTKNVATDSFPLTMYAAGPGSNPPFVYKSTNGGTNWAAAATGLPTTGASTAALAVDPTDLNRVLFAMPLGIYLTTDGGASWTVSINGLTAWPVAAVASDATQARTVYAGTLGSGGWRSTDGGASWAPMNTGPNATFAYSILGVGLNTFIGAGLGIFVSPDHGVTWNLVSNAVGNVVAIAVAPSNPMVMYAGGGSVVTSADGGLTWGMSGLGMRVQALVVDPQNPMIAYAGMPTMGVMRTSNGGANWSPVNTGLTQMNVLSLAIHPTAAGTLFAGTDNGLFKTTNGAGSWTVTSGTAGVAVDSIVVHPTNPTQLFAGTTTGGVYHSSDGGDTFTAMNGGLDNPFVNQIALDRSNPDILYAATTGGGVYKAMP
jgi:hypothetical protein